MIFTAETKLIGRQVLIAKGLLRARLLSLVLSLLLFPLAVNAQWRIDHVVDGDSLRLFDTNGQRVTVRLAGIDAPEKTQAYADRSRQNLQALVSDCAPEVQIQKIDRYGRSISQVFCGERDLALAQLESGLAWHFSRYANEQPPALRTAYVQAEQRSKEAGLGLWKDEAPIEPWSFRDQQRASRRSPRN